MGRWEPNASERLAEAAIELFRSRGYDETTVADIAAHAGLTERTFFRYFADKREVLFFGQDLYRDTVLAGVVDAPADASALDAALGGYLAVARTIFAERHPHSRTRSEVIAANPALVERELIKAASVAAQVQRALEERGVDPASALLAAQTGSAVFHAAFAEWTSSDERPLDELILENATRLRAVTRG